MPTLPEQIREPVEAVWRHHLEALAAALDESIRGLLNLLRLDDYHRHGHESGRLEKALGPFGAERFDMGALSAVLGGSGGSRSMPDDRVARIRELVERLGELHRRAVSPPTNFPGAGIVDDEPEIHRRAEMHFNRMAEYFCCLRIAQLEIHSKYDQAEHGRAFAGFDWRRLNEEELRLCPPFVIAGEVDGSGSLRKAVALLESRKPFKVVIVRSHLKERYPVAADTRVPPKLSIELLPVALRGIAFLQSCPAVADHQRRVFDALCSPRPGLLSLLGPRDGEAGAAFLERCHRALCARAFPAVRYDPDQSAGMVACVDLSGNPADREAIPFTEFAASEPEFAGDLSTTDADAGDGERIPVADFLRLSRRQRLGKRPFVEGLGPHGEPQQKIVSDALVTQMTDQSHLWKSLRELAGIDNPHVVASTEALRAECEAQARELDAKRAKAFENDRARIEQAAVAGAVRRLVARFTGVAPTAIDPERMLRDAGIETANERE